MDATEYYTWINVDEQAKKIKESVRFRMKKLDGSWFFTDVGARPNEFSEETKEDDVYLTVTGESALSAKYYYYKKYYVYKFNYHVTQVESYDFTYRINADLVPGGVDKEAFVRNRAYKSVGMSSPQ